MCKVRQQFISNPNTPRAHSGPVRIFGAVWGVWGVAEFKLRLQADFNLSSHTPCTPGRGAADEIWSKMEPGAPKGRLCQGPGPILARSEKVPFLERPKNDQKSTKIGPKCVAGTLWSSKTMGHWCRI